MKTRHLLGFLLFLSCLSFAQEKWYIYPGNLVLSGGKEGWSPRFMFRKVFAEDDRYRVWYVVKDSNRDQTIATATSKDGIHWERHEGEPIDFKYPTDLWNMSARQFEILKLDTAYFIWHLLPEGENTGRSLGFAWSKDGYKWTKYPEPVLQKGKDDAWDARGPICPVVWFDGKQFYMIYTASDKRLIATQKAGLATSRDGIHWQKYPGNPVLDIGKEGEWDDTMVRPYSITFNGREYELWYAGYNRAHWQIGKATSTDGIHWKRYAGNPVIRPGAPGERDWHFIGAPEVILKDSVYRMWYYGLDNYRLDFRYATTSEEEYQTWDTASILRSERILNTLVFNKLNYIKVDSLTEILPELSGTALINTYNRLAIAYAFNDEKRSLDYATKALALSNEMHYPEGRAMALYCMGTRSFLLDDYSEALVKWLASLRIYDSLEMYSEMGAIQSKISEIHTRVRSLELAIEYDRKALAAYQHIKDTANMLKTMIYLGYHLLNTGDRAGALETFRKRLDLIKKKEYETLADAYAYIGHCYVENNLDSAMHLFNKSLSILRAKAPLNTHWVIHLMANACFAAGPEHYGEAGKYFQMLNDTYWRERRNPGNVRMLLDIAEFYLATGRYDECRRYLDAALPLSKLWLSKLLKHRLSSTGKLHYDWALKSDLERAHMIWYRLDSTLHRETSSLRHYKLAILYRDSVINEKERLQWAMLQGQYNTERAQNRVSMLEKENEVKSLEVRQTRTVLFIIMGLVMIVVIATYLYFRQRKIKADHERMVSEERLMHKLELEKVEADKLKELDHMKSRFFADISHEFRTPLTLIMRPIEKLLTKPYDEKDKKDLNVAIKYVKSLQNLINNLLTLSRIESGKMQLRASEMNIVKLVKGYFQAFESLGKQKNLSLKFLFDAEEIDAYIDKEKFEQILNNLLSNAFKFTPEGGRIIVEVSSPQSALGSPFNAEHHSPSHHGTTAPRHHDTISPHHHITISIKDSGPGIAPEHLAHIFDRFYRVEDQGGYSEGTGIGLALTKELVELHHGTITVESEVGNGTTFIITLPLGKDHLKEEEIAQSTEPRAQESGIRHPGSGIEDPASGIQDQASSIQDQASSIQDPDTDHQSLVTSHQSPILLIVEDNIDMREYIREYFEHDFRIIEAAEGAEGFAKAVEQTPDFIISDVMMPGMDGNEFCRKIKSDMRTSHIPVILLTARASKESRIEGLETGADDFITKPFDGDELQVRVRNLLAQRKKVSEMLERKIRRTHSAFRIDFTDSGITSMDEQFLQKAIIILKEQHADPEFNAQKFSPAIGLSIAQLNRKIKALTGQTTGDFIRTFRLLRAAELMKKKSGTVAETAYDVGFSSPSYFTECFHEHFGVTPSEYSENS
jgi:signal transduction histidine kinase/DNA-binding response OmpR family regulator/predicted GH43/DUF377 family glycosyl hydrolase/Tfp pilus assembly protein PilF